MPSGLESLLRLLPSADQRSLLLEIGPVVCCQLQQSSLLLFDLIAGDNALWQQLYRNSFNLQDEREIEALSIFRATLATHPSAGQTDASGSSVWRDDESSHPTSNSNSNSNSNHTGTAVATSSSSCPSSSSSNGTRRNKRKSSIRAFLRRRNTASRQSLRQIAWWQRVFALRHRLGDRWRKGDPQLQMVPLPAFLGHLPQPGASYGPWIVIRTFDYRLYLGDITALSNDASGTFTLSLSSSSSSKHSSIPWHPLPLESTWDGQTINFIFSSLINDRYVAVVAVYGEQNVLYVWSTTTRHVIYKAVLPNKGNIDQLYGDYVVMSSLSGNRALTIVDLLHGITFQIEDVIQNKYWHLQRYKARHQDGLVIYCATEHEGIITWSLVEFTQGATDQLIHPATVESGRLELLSNLHQLYGTGRIDDHRVLISMSFFERQSISHIGVHDLRHGIQARIEWSHALSGRVISPILSENLLLCHGSVYTVVCLEEGIALRRLSSRHENGLQRLLGPWIGESFPQKSQPILVTDVNSGKIVHQFSNTQTRSTGRRYYSNLRAGYLLEMFANEPTLYIWNFLCTRK